MWQINTQSLTFYELFANESNQDITITSGILESHYAAVATTSSSYIDVVVNSKSCWFSDNSACHIAKDYHNTISIVLLIIWILSCLGIGLICTI